MISSSSCQRTVKSDSRPASLPHEAMPQLSGASDTEGAVQSAGWQSFIPTDEFRPINPPQGELLAFISPSSWSPVNNRYCTHEQSAPNVLTVCVSVVKQGTKLTRLFLGGLFQVSRVQKKLTHQSGKQTRPVCNQHKLFFYGNADASVTLRELQMHQWWGAQLSP